MQITAREREICDLLRKEPLISQEELAARLRITRSSVAVHISNLIKKGIIIGKGYVFSQQTVCAVVGDAGLLTQVVPGEPDLIDRKPIGLAIKGCQALQSLDLSVKVFTVLGTDKVGDDLLALLAESADINGVVRPADSKSKQWVQIRGSQKTEKYSNFSEGGSLIDLLDYAPHRWLDCDYLWVQPEYIGEITTIIKASTDQVPQTVTCLLQPQVGCEAVDTLILGVPKDKEIELNFDNNLLVFTDGYHYVKARHQDEEIEVNILPGQHFNIENQLERFTAGLIYGLSHGIQLRQALRIAVGNTTYQV